MLLVRCKCGSIHVTKLNEHYGECEECKRKVRLYNSCIDAEAPRFLRALQNISAMRNVDDFFEAFNQCKRIAGKALYARNRNVKNIAPLQGDPDRMSANLAIHTGELDGLPRSSDAIEGDGTGVITFRPEGTNMTINSISPKGSGGVILNAEGESSIHELAGHVIKMMKYNDVKGSNLTEAGESDTISPLKRKPGDKVVVRQDLIDGECYDEISYITEMSSYLGKTVTIKSIVESCVITPCYQIEEDGGWHYWTDSMFEN